MTADLTAKIFHDEDAARAHFQALRWPHGPVCPFCSSVDNATEMKGATTRPGLFKCKAKECRKPFSATMGTVYERSHIPLHKWLLATHLMVASKKGISSHQLYRMLGFGSYKTAWFMAHRIRAAMSLPPEPAPLGGKDKIVEADETYIGGKESNKHANKRDRRLHKDRKAIVVSLVERSGRVRSFHVANVTAKTVRNVIVTAVSRETHLMTDSARLYPRLGKEFSAHSMVDHSAGEYVRDFIHHSNTVENYFSILKRGLTGVFHHVSEAHLHRYLAEFDFRYSNRSGLGITDKMRADEAVRGVVGKRLTYRQPRQAA
ncbi:MAG: IS1595 family transposase [Caulobacteraceae bacterium]